MLDRLDFLRFSHKNNRAIALFFKTRFIERPSGTCQKDDRRQNSIDRFISSILR